MNLSQVCDRRFWSRWTTAGAVLSGLEIRRPKIKQMTSHIASGCESDAALVQAAIQAVEQQTGLRLTFSLNHRFPLYPWGDERSIAFFSPGRKFRFWSSPSASNPDDYWALRPLPVYHPALRNSFSYMVNACTEALIHKGSVQSILCPEEARQPRGEKYLSSSWSLTTHPFYATGSSFSIHTRKLEQDSVAELTALLLAALEHEGQWINISGGFNAAYNYPMARVKQNKGSEANAVWGYLTLCQEGKLTGSIIPSWLLREEWPQKFAPLVRELTPKLAPFLP